MKATFLDKCVGIAIILLVATVMIATAASIYGEYYR